MNQTTEPLGAIWSRNWNLKSSVLSYMNGLTHTCPKCAFEFTETRGMDEISKVFTPHTMAVKINVLKQKFLAVENTKKSASTHPDYFVFVYQEYTGAPSIPPFSDKRPAQEKG